MTDTYRPLSTVQNPTRLEAAVLHACSHSRRYSIDHGCEEGYIFTMDGDLVSHVRGSSYTTSTVGRRALWYEPQHLDASVLQWCGCVNLLISCKHKRKKQASCLCPFYSSCSSQTHLPLYRCRNKLVFKSPRQPVVHIHSHPADSTPLRCVYEENHISEKRIILRSSPASSHDFDNPCVFLRFHVVTADGLLYTYERTGDAWPTREMLKQYEEEENRRSDSVIEPLLDSLVIDGALSEEISTKLSRAQFELQVQIFKELGIPVKCYMERLFPHPSNPSLGKNREIKYRRISNRGCHSRRCRIRKKYAKRMSQIVDR